jgi:membrane protein implicated in regulation of membrane protease activity
MTLFVVAVGWMYVVLLMALVEGMSPQGTWLGAFFTLLLYGVLPLAIVLYILGRPARRRAARAREALAAQPDGSGEAAGDAVAAERKEP